MDVRTKEELDEVKTLVTLNSNRLWWLMKEINPKAVEKLEKEENKGD